MLAEYNVWITGAVIIVGVIEWLKGLLKTCFGVNVPAWLPSLLLPVVCFGVAAAKGEGVWYNTLGMLSVSEAGYALIWQSIKGIFKAGVPGQKTSKGSDQ